MESNHIRLNGTIKFKPNLKHSCFEFVFGFRLFCTIPYSKEYELREALELHQEEHENAGRDDYGAEEHVEEPLDPNDRIHVLFVQSVVAAGAQVRVVSSWRQRARDVQRPVARVRFAAGERDQCLARGVEARNLERAVPVHGALIVPLRVRVADATTFTFSIYS